MSTAPPPPSNSAVPPPPTSNLPSTDVVLPTDAPTYLAKYQDSSAAAGSLITSGLVTPALSIQGKQFAYGEIKLALGAPVQIVILSNDPPNGCAKAYYKGAFKPDSSDAPDCASSNGTTPDAFIAKPVSQSCASCAFNAFGSGLGEDGETPTKGKRCSDFKNLYIVLGHDIGGVIYNLRVPATSLKALSAFGRKLVEKSVPMQVMLIEITFADTVHPQIEFNPIRWLDEADAATAISRSKSDHLLNLLPSKYSNAPADAATEAAIAGTLEAPDFDVRKMTAKAGGTSYESYIEAGWDDEALIKGGYMEEPVARLPDAAIPPPPAAKSKVMTAQASVSYEKYIEAGWDDDQLIASGFMEIK